MLMNRTGPRKQLHTPTQQQQQQPQQQQPREALPQTLQRALLLCAALVICAFIYVFVGMQSKKEAATITLMTPAAAPQTPVPAAHAPIEGVREPVMLERMQHDRLELDTYDAATRRCAIRLIGEQMADAQQKASSAQGMLELYVRDGYVCGLSLELEIPLPSSMTSSSMTPSSMTPPSTAPPSTAPPSTALPEEDAYALGQQFAAQSLYEEALEARQALMHAVLMQALSILDMDGEVPMGVVLMWESAAEALREDSEPIMETAGSFVFTASRTRAGKLLLSLSR